MIKVKIQNKEKKSKKKRFFWLLCRIFIIFTVLFCIFWLVLRFSAYPQLNAFIGRPNSVRYYDRNGILLQITPLTGGLRREIPQTLPAQLKDVFVFAEDRRFYNHFGIDGIAVFRALFQNIRHSRRISGASTITMQLARLIADNAQTSSDAAKPPPAGKLRNTLAALNRKTTEAFNALRLETRFSKDEILELYLNSLPFGFNSEGAATASRTFFACDVSMLSPAQAFMLAVIPRRPSYYNPLENPDNAIKAAAELQARFSKNKKLKSKWPLFSNISEEDWKFTVSSAARFNYPFEFPHLIRYINSGNVTGNNSYSSNKQKRAISPNMRNENGEIHLSVDLELQHFLEDAIAGNVTMYYSSRLTNGAAVVIDNLTGEILAWVGSADFHKNETSGQVDGVLALNQPGSSMKPFLYAMALENGYKPTDIIADIQMLFGESEIYIPRNFNDRFNGPMLFRTALASSLNIPAVYLLYRMGIKNYTDLLFSLGFDSLESSYENAGLGLALGNAPVSLLELVNAFSVFPRDGIYLHVTYESQNDTEQSDGNKLGNRIFSEDTARLICSFLSDSNARVLAFGRARNFQASFPVIFKTGTANQYQSIVALGASMKYTIGVWMGNFSGETVIGKTGSSIPAAMARDTLIFLHGKNNVSGGNYQSDNLEFQKPKNWQLKRVCALSGMTPTDACLSVINEYVKPEEAANFCTWHNIVNGRSQTTFPAEYQSWFSSSIRQGTIDYSSSPLEIITPRSGYIYLSSHGTGEIPVEVIGGSENILRITHNGRTFIKERPFNFNIERIQGSNKLYVQNGNEEDEVTFLVSGGY